MRKLNLILVLLAVMSIGAAPSRPFNYVAQTTIDPAQNNTNESTLYSYLQAGVDTYSPGSITNVDISSSAAISASKINLLGSITNADVSPTAGIVYSKLDLTDDIVNADINSAAAIVDTKLATISTAGKVSGAALTSFTSIPSGAGVVPTANLGSGTANSTTALFGDQTYKTITDLNTGNSLFSYSGSITTPNVSEAEVIGSTLLPNGVTGTYRFLQTAPPISTYVPIWTNKWIKVEGVSTITVWARIWVRIAGSNNQANIRVNVGGQTGNVSGTNQNTTPEWKSFTIDVSSLSNGTSYDVTAEMTNIGNTTEEVYCSNIVAYGS